MIYNQDQVKSIFQEVEALLSKQSVIFIGVAGIPGVGKSMFSKSILKQKYPQSIVIPMDGYHIYRNQLDENGLKYRGAPFTFDWKRLKQNLINLKQSGEGSFPSFEHDLKDPVEDSIVINKENNIIIVEGLYLFLTEWDVLLKLKIFFLQISAIFDIKIMIRGDEDIVADRLAMRHIQSGICGSAFEAKQRVMENDMVNGQYLLQNSELSELFYIDI